MVRWGGVGDGATRHGHRTWAPGGNPGDVRRAYRSLLPRQLPTRHTGPKGLSLNNYCAGGRAKTEQDGGGERRGYWW